MNERESIEKLIYFLLENPNDLYIRSEELIDKCHESLDLTAISEEHLCYIFKFVTFSIRGAISQSTKSREGSIIEVSERFGFFRRVANVFYMFAEEGECKDYIFPILEDVLERRNNDLMGLYRFGEW